MHNDVVNNSRLVAPVTGVYRITGHLLVAYAGAVDADVFVAISVDGTTFIVQEEGHLDADDSLRFITLNPNTSYQLTAGQYVELTVTTATPGGTLLFAPESSPEFMMELVA